MIRFDSSLADLMVPAQNISPHPDNPNNGDTDEIVSSILRVGCYRPIIASRKTGYILAGHHLYAALLELGAKMVPVVWSDADDESQLRIMLGDNKIARLARLDESLELDLLERLSATEVGLSATGSSDADLERLRKRVLSDVTDPLKIDLRGPERLIHEIECPACHHVWVRGQGQED